MSVCSICDDTHTMVVPREGHEDRHWPCTHCPVPCQACRFGGNGAFCSKTPCGCACHKPKQEPTPAVTTRDEAEQAAYARGLADGRRAGIEEAARMFDAASASKREAARREDLRYADSAYSQTMRAEDDEDNATRIRALSTNDRNGGRQ